MTDEKTETPAETKPERAAPKRERLDQDQVMADRITATLEIIHIVQQDSELAGLLAPRGYDAAKLAQGLTKQQAAQSAFAARQQAMSAQKDGTNKVTELAATAQQAYSDFRETARGIFKDPVALAAVGVTGKLARDREKFITQAKASYEGALANPGYLSELARFGFPEPAVRSAQATLDALVDAEAAQEAGKASATRATKARDEAVEEMDGWMSQFRAIARVATRSRPDLAKKLGI
jgi:hypothetical protein